MKKKKKVKYPFFIVGCNRSGTSLLRTMLNHHPLLAVPTESVFLVDYLETKKYLSIDVLKKMVINEPWIKEEWGINVNENDLDGVKSTKDIITRLHEIYATKNGKKYWGNKTSRFTDKMEILNELFPDAVFINLIRDPRGVVLSLIQNKMFKSNAYFGANKWVNHVIASNDFYRHHPNDLLEIKYEDFVNDPEKTLKKVCKFINVRYSAKMFEYMKTGMSEYHPLNKTLHKGINLKPFKYKIDYWKVKLSKNQIRVIDYVCFPYMQNYGYKTENYKLHIRIYEYIYFYINRVIGFAVQLIYYFIKWPKYFFYTIWRKLVFGTLDKEIIKMSF